MNVSGCAQDDQERVFQQSNYSVRFEWGQEGVTQFAPLSAVVVIVDVLSFTTCVDAAVSRGAVVYPYRYKDESADAFAQSVDAQLAGKRGVGLSLSPPSLLHAEEGSRIVLPSPNGSTCTVLAAKTGTAVVAGCIRNASAVAEYVKREYPDGVVSVIACGEHWPNGRLRPAIEDLLGAGAILSHFDSARLSPEASVAMRAFKQAEHELQDILANCSSGQELIAKGFPEDIAMASTLNQSSSVPVLQNGAYVGAR